MTNTPPTDAARELMQVLSLWFFRDLNDNQRLGLIRLIYGEDVAREANCHHHQRMILRRIVRDLAATRQQPEAGREGEATLPDPANVPATGSLFRDHPRLGFKGLSNAATRLAVPTVVGREEVADLPDRIWLIGDLDGETRWSPDNGCEGDGPTTPYVRASAVRLTAVEVEAALRWYAETVGKCRMIHSEGEEARNALHRDCGERAEKALALMEKGNG